MTRLLLIIVMLIQLSGCAVFWETAGATLVGNLASELIKHELAEEDDEKEKSPEK
jgi:hypothetical protein